MLVGHSAALGCNVLLSACDDTVVRLFGLGGELPSEKDSLNAEVKRLNHELAKRDEKIVNLQNALDKSSKSDPNAGANSESVSEEDAAELVQLKSELASTKQRLVAAEQKLATTELAAKRKQAITGADEILRLKSELSAANQKLQSKSTSKSSSEQVQLLKLELAAVKQKLTAAGAASLFTIYYSLLGLGT